jgi:catechol 2,3-dioxygenase-like lactoylglutathione lyase family enzyme
MATFRDIAGTNDAAAIRREAHSARVFRRRVRVAAPNRWTSLMSIETIFANVSCSDLRASAAWYEKLFGKPATRRPMQGLAEWQLTESAEMQLYEAKEHAGHSTLTLGVMPIEPERERLDAAGLKPGPVEAADDFFIVRLRDPDGNLVVLASAKRR